MPLSLTTVFADVADPRIETANKLHTLTDILVIATCAVMCALPPNPYSPSRPLGGSAARSSDR